MKKIIPSLITSGLALAAASAQADDAGMIESLSGYNVNESAFTKSTGINIGGWASGGITYASHNSFTNSNAPISFNDRINEFQLNQLNLFIEKAVNKGDKWDFGGRVDFMFGTDSRKTQATGWDDRMIPRNNGLSPGEGERFYDVAFPQAYAEIYAPFGNGITAKIGHFYTLIGYEVVTSPDNFFYSHAYTMLYGEPFTHTGALLSYDINDNISVTAGAVMGWDNFRANPGAWNFLGSASYTTDDDNTSLTVAMISGDKVENEARNTSMYSVVLQHNFTENLHYVLQHDFGVEQRHPGVGRDADWYGINQYLTYDINDKLSAGLRGEWFRDGMGVRTGILDSATQTTFVGGNYYAVTAGLNYKPMSWLKLRPEVRYDWFDANGNAQAFDAGTENDQIAVSMDMIVAF
ncbi:porin [Methylomonas sp. SURF-2]|uniref:Porin n=1 Tax=Methylomonas subterranea TaxID=2952225 RepID=A0ABT1TBU2_9GAMM|nr:porin [Methylomonas sp. SURF-2]MCQ8102774.1 porin [Methylomonas sp. SURF-2]